MRCFSSSIFNGIERGKNNDNKKQNLKDIYWNGGMFGIKEEKCILVKTACNKNKGKYLK